MAATTHIHPLLLGGRKHFSTRVKHGMWVVVGRHVGIANALYINGPKGLARTTLEDDKVTHIEFHRVDARGVTIAVEIEPVRKVRKAAWNEIPLPRRPNMFGARWLGYQ